MADAAAISAPSTRGATVPVSTARARAKEKIASCLARRSEAGLLLADDAERVARACHAMAVRFHRGGKLVVFGAGGPSADAQHVAVEFVHPVIVSKRALPAISLTTDVATVTGIAEREGVAAIFAHQIRFLADPADIALGISVDGHSASVLAGLEAAAELGLLTIALAGGDSAAGDGGPIMTSKAVDHLLWELVHVFFEQPGVLAPGVLS